MSPGGTGMPEVISLAVSDQAQLASLRNLLQAQPGVQVTVTPGKPGAGELGALDILTVLVGSSSLVAVIKTLPEFIRSRRTGFHIETTVRGRPFTLDATNVDELMPTLKRLLDD